MQRRERSEVDATLKAVLDAAPSLLSIFVELHPYDPSFGNAFAKRLRKAASELWQALVQQLPDVPALQLLYNAAAEASSHPSCYALLCFYAEESEDNQLRSAGRLLRTRLYDQLSENPLARVLMDVSPGQAPKEPPNLAEVTQFKAGLRLRYSLANALRSDEPIEELIRRARSQHRATDYLRTRELITALEAGVALGCRNLPLSEAAFFLLRPEDQRVLTSSPKLRSLALPATLRKHSRLTRAIADARKYQNTILESFERVKAALSDRDFGRASRLLEDLPADETTLRLGRQWWTSALRDRLRERQPGARAIDEPWVPLSDQANKRLREFDRRSAVTNWWRLSASEIAIEIENLKLDPTHIESKVLARIQQTWVDTDHRGLFDAGFVTLIPVSAALWDSLDLPMLVGVAQRHPRGAQLLAPRLAGLPDARPVLALMAGPGAVGVRQVVAEALRRMPKPTTWGRWVIPCLGTPEWELVKRQAAAGVHVQELALERLPSADLMVRPAAFASALFQSILAMRANAKRRAGMLNRYLQTDPSALKLMLTQLRPAALDALLRQVTFPVERLDELGALVSSYEVDDATRQVIRSARLVRAPTAAKLQAMLLEDQADPHGIPWNDEWLKLRGSTRTRAIALVLATRRAPRRLKALGSILGDEELVAGMREAAALLPVSARRDSGFLQLAAALGASMITTLAAAMAMTDPKAKPGHRLDAAYHRYQLPKRSGGTRVISSPHRFVKLTQRAILDRLIQPLGAHPCAFGFVVGRSIAGNAQVHVGQHIVSNADVRNCFPSVRWPLVLGVLRRDLGDRLGPGAISLLVDICTAEGGLPIGAPTSPALLNRVLLKSDQMLEAAAQRLGCRYTRYADDLTFSGDHGAVKLLGIAKRTLSQIGLELDPKKTTIYRPGRRQIVTGLVVNEKVNIPRRLRRRMRAAVHAVEQGRPPQWHGEVESVQSLQGRLAFSHAVNPQQALPLMARLDDALGKGKRKSKRKGSGRRDA
jgi:retron-type reverse transcriptase